MRAWQQRKISITKQHRNYMRRLAVTAGLMLSSGRQYKQIRWPISRDPTSVLPDREMRPNVRFLSHFHLGHPRFYDPKTQFEAQVSSNVSDKGMQFWSFYCIVHIWIVVCQNGLGRCKFRFFHSTTWFSIILYRPRYVENFTMDHLLERKIDLVEGLSTFIYENMVWL